MEHELVGRKCTIKDSGSLKVWDIVAVDKRIGIKDSPLYRLAYDGVLNEALFHGYRLDVLPLPADKTIKHFDYGVGLDAPRVTNDEATELLAHMLGLAHMYFQATPDDMREEVVRLIALREGDNPNGSVMIGAMAAYDAWHAHYERLKAED